MLPRLNSVSVRPGDLVRWDGVTYTTLWCRSGIAALRDIETAARVDVDLVSMADEDGFEVLGNSGPAVLGEMGAASEQVVLMSLTEQQKHDVIWWRDHLNEVIHQVVNPLDSDARPRPGYDSVRITERRELKVSELRAAGVATSRASFARKEKAFRERGLMGLLDGRATRRGSQAPSADPRLEQAVIDVLAETTHQSTVTRAVHINRVKALVRKRHGSDETPVALPSERTLRRLLDAHDVDRLSTGKATTRRTESNRPDRAFSPLVVSRPGEIVEADSTPVNMQIVMPDGKTLSRPILTVLVDRCTRSIIAWAFHEDSTTGYDIAYLIARALRPVRYWAGAPEPVKLLGSGALPGLKMVALDERQRDALALPYIVPETITTDRGKDYLSANVLRVCAMFGISVIQAPPHSPTAKGVVERTLGAAETMWMQYQEHYVGNSVSNRGRQMRGDAATLEEVERSFAEWVVRVWQNRPHPALASRDIPGRRFSPNQMAAACFDSAPGVPVPIDANTFISLLPTQTRTVQPDGVNFRNEVYDSPALDGYRKTKHPATRDGKWVLHYDPYDADRIWVSHPEDGSFIECVARGVRLSALPFGDSMVESLRAMPPADAGVQDEWAVEYLVAAEERRGEKERAPRASVRTEERAGDSQDAGGTGDAHARRTDGPADAPTTTRKKRKAASKRARRDADDMPQPAPVTPAPLPPAPPARVRPGDYTVATNEEYLDV